MLSGDNEEVAQPFPLQMVPNTLYSRGGKSGRITDVYSLTVEGKSVKALQHLETETATAINISLFIQASVVTFTPDSLFISFQMGFLAEWLKLQTQQFHINTKINLQRPPSRPRPPGSSSMLPAAGIQTD